MSIEELREKMELLGIMLHEKEEMEYKFLEEHKDFFQRIEDRKDEIQKEILLRQAGEKSEKLIVTYNKGAIRWDTKGLEDYGLAHPEIMALRKRGAPVVGFRLRPEGMSDE